MNEPAGLLEVGRIGKPHGLKGELLVSLSTTLIEQRTTPGTVLWAGGQQLTVRSTRPHKGKWLFLFEEVGDRNGADLLHGQRLSAEPIEAEGEVFIHELVDLDLVDQHGTNHGTVVAVVDNPASDLLELADGRLVPLSFYLDHDASEVRVDVPPGLLDDEALDDRS